MAKRRWAGYPTATVYEAAEGSKVKDLLLWGREFDVLGPPSKGRVPVGVPKVLPEASLDAEEDPHPRKPRGWVPVGQVAEAPVLEIVFVDIGQGDGCLLVMPDGKRLLVDAGEGDNMARFLKWRFGNFADRTPFDIVMSHSDLDHYGGFRSLFEAEGFSAGTIYHNGLVERNLPKAESLGRKETLDGKTYVVDIVRNDDDMSAILGSDRLVGKKVHPRLLRVASQKTRRFRSLGIVRGSGERAYLPGFEANKPVSIEILGPVLESVGRTQGLRWFGDIGKTKNGHSVVMKLVFGRVSILLGGDLNIKSENLLLEAHTGLPSPPADALAEEALVNQARGVFECEIAKACHHGSADFAERFLKSVNAIATVISSGDEEAYAHPRPDALGAYGVCGRGARPLLFSTELARSSAERIKYPGRFRKELADIVNAFAKAAAENDPAKADKAREKFDRKLLDITRSVSVYGAINVRTDGERAVLAYMVEKPTSPSRKWDLYRLEPGEDGRLRFTPKDREDE